jgi:NADH-quinone oxidoreductase subunit M
MGLLSLLIWLPIFGGLLLLLLGSGDAVAGKRRPDRWLALVISVANFFLSLPLYMGFDVTTSNMQFVEKIPWIETFRVEYFLGVDGFSLPLILLTTFLTPIVIIAGWEVIKKIPA